MQQNAGKYLSLLQKNLLKNLKPWSDIVKKAFICFLFMFIVAGFLSAGPGYANPAREGRDDMHSGMDAMKEGRYEEAIEMFEKAYDNFKEADLSRGMGKALRKIGWANHVLSRYDEALENYKKALEIFIVLN